MSSPPDIIYNEYGMDTGYMDRLRKLRPKAMWVKNYYGGSDLYSPTMNGDVRTVIQGCPTLWFREVAGYPNHVACMEFNELSAVISRENWQIATPWAFGETGTRGTLEVGSTKNHQTVDRRAARSE
ncbi:hypothetical protein D6D23_01198 [Aureobasidium pullulans]|uniref:Uncharacterized protein n=1 Tax=Aureobasidium pullulans TaxID=5580 RepID=A0A4S8WSF1_AURPU|nr:hypothetical protein D6D23_01198 [Aureobasidium pullulans]THW64587.1 hypothetical protein D6D20_02725 [Aureobasidium pullulans]